jgi:hypothetical protein
VQAHFFRSLDISPKKDMSPKKSEMFHFVSVRKALYCRPARKEQNRVSFLLF